MFYFNQTLEFKVPQRKKNTHAVQDVGIVISVARIDNKRMSGGCVPQHRVKVTPTSARRRHGTHHRKGAFAEQLSKDEVLGAHSCRRHLGVGLLAGRGIIPACRSRSHGRSHRRIRLRVVSLGGLCHNALQQAYQKSGERLMLHHCLCIPMSEQGELGIHTSAR